MKKDTFVPYKFIDNLENQKPKKVSDEKFSEMLGVSYNTYKQWKYHPEKHQPKLSNAVKAAAACGVSIDYLCGIDPYKNKGDKEISEITGLNQQAIDTLRLLKKLSKDINQDSLYVLNFILSDEKLFFEFIDSLKLYIDNPYTIPLHTEKGALTESKEGCFFAGRETPLMCADGKPHKYKKGFSYIAVDLSIFETWAKDKMQKVIDTWQRRFRSDQK